MPLVIPTTSDLQLWLEDSTITDAQATLGIRNAINLLYAATGILWDDIPPMLEGNAQFEEIAKNGILDMAAWLLNYTVFSATLSAPFTSEHIGSYSYSKSRNAMELITMGMPAGVMWFDILVKMLLALHGSSVVLAGSTQVFGSIPATLHAGIDNTTSQLWVLSPTEREFFELKYGVSG